MKRKGYASTLKGKRKRESPDRITSEREEHRSPSELGERRLQGETEHWLQMSAEYDSDLGESS
jgi:hypothetical protein